MEYLLLTVFILFVKSSLQETCNYGDIPVFQSFDVNKFLGVWYEIERTTFQWGENGTWHSSAWNWYQGGDSKIFVAYGGFSRNWQQCSKDLYGEVTGINGKYIVTNENKYQAALQVVYTDYNVALIYLCYEREIDGRCHTNSVHASLFSRHQFLSSNQRRQLISHLDNNCVHETDLSIADQGLCTEPKPDQSLLG